MGEERWFGKEYNAIQPTFQLRLIIKNAVLKTKRSAGIKMLKKPCQPIENNFLFIDFMCI